MTKHNVAELAEALNAANPAVDEDGRRLAFCIYEALAEGEPVTADDVARRAGADGAWVRKTLDGWTGVFFDDDGRIVGFWGLGLPEMDHRFEIDGKTLYTWCAWDPLFLAPLLGVEARVSSVCPVTGATVTLRVGPEGIADADPPDAVLSFLRPTPDMGDNAINSFCHFVRLFASRDAAEAWIADRPGTFVLDLDDAFELANATFGRLKGERATPEGEHPL